MAQIRILDVQGATNALAEGAVLVDVREDDEWLAGHSAHAIHIPLAELPDHLAELPHDQLIVCVCRSGHRSLRAANFLAEGGFAAANLEGGMTAWDLAGEPLVADSGNPSIQ
ncbi:MAG: rhodanese-like domain-containing protein [Acidimicrobiales bacterium]|jgi:rhodanese-related sulfurtransferase